MQSILEEEKRLQQSGMRPLVLEEAQLGQALKRLLAHEKPQQVSRPYSDQSFILLCSTNSCFFVWCCKINGSFRLYRFKVKLADTAQELLKDQSKKMALKRYIFERDCIAHFPIIKCCLLLSSVQRGISWFKQDRFYDAILCYRQALSYDEQNVEAYVARGAL